MKLRNLPSRLCAAALLPALIVASLIAFLTPHSASAALGSAFYTLDPVPFYNSHPNGPDHRWVLSLVDNKLQITLPPDTPLGGQYNFFAKTGLIGGQQYTAVLTLRTVTPSTYPNTFYAFARPSIGGTTQYDIWQSWLGEAGESARTLTIPLDLAAYTAGNWTFYLGITGPGSYIIDSLVIYNGTTKENIAAVPNAASASNLPAGVNAATGASTITLTPPAATSNIVTLSTLVANSTSASAANSTALQSALTNTPRPATILVPPGTYYFSGIRSINFDGRDDLTFDGQGATFVVRQINNDGNVFFIRQSDRLVIKNLTVDWDWSVKPIASLGVVSNLSADKKTCDFTFPNLDATQTEATRVAGWTKIFEMDATNLVRTGDAMLSVPSNPVLTIGSASNVIHAVFSSALALENGKSYCIRHLYYEMNAFKTLDSTHVLFDNVTIRSVPGMGWLFGAATHHVRVANSRIARAAGSTTPLTSAADGLHFGESQGYIAVENTVFQGMGDDSINIHDNCYQGLVIPNPADPLKLTLRKCKDYQLRIYDTDTEVDTIEFYAPDYGNLNGSPTVVSRVATSAVASGEDLVITFQSAIPTPLSPNAILRNARFNSSHVRIANCEFIEANGHGILFSGQNATIENNLFRRVYVTPIQLEANIVPPLWAEGRGATNVLIRNNTFLSSNQLAESDGAAIWAGHSLPWGTVATYLYKTITVENNSFSGFPGPVASLNNASNIVVRNNDVIYDGPVPKATRHFGSLLVTKSEKLGLGGNDWANLVTSTYPYGVVYDSDNVSTVATNFNAAINAVSNVLQLASETFERYAAGSSFTTSQTLGAAGSGWAYGWRTAGSFATPTGTISASSPLADAQRLGASIVTQSGKTAATGAVTRAYDASSLSTQNYTARFVFRPDSTPSNIRYLLSDLRTRAAGTDGTAAWQIGSVNGTWQVYNGAPANAYVDTGMSVTAGTAYTFAVSLNPVAKTWAVTISNGSSTVTQTGLATRFSSYATDSTEAVGGRWLNFAAQELVTSGTTVGATGTFSVDAIVLEKP